MQTTAQSSGFRSPAKEEVIEFILNTISSPTESLVYIVKAFLADDENIANQI